MKKPIVLGTLTNVEEQLIQEITLQSERVNQLEYGLEQLKSQLIDGGFKEDSLIIISIDNLCQKK